MRRRGLAVDESSHHGPGYPSLSLWAQGDNNGLRAEDLLIWTFADRGNAIDVTRRNDSERGILGCFLEGGSALWGYPDLSMHRKGGEGSPGGISALVVLI